MDRDTAKPKHRGLRRILLAILLLLFLFATIFLLYSADYYRPDSVAVDARAWGDAEGLIHETSNYIAVGDPETAEMGYIFYPGGKVDAGAYLPYLLELNAYEDIFCAVVKPPFRLAILDVNAGDRLREDYPQIGTWAVGGHSLGGASAARYVEKHMEDSDLAALVLLASYPDVDLSSWDKPVLSVSAGMDQILDRDRYEKAMALLPPQPGTTYYFLSNGNHSGFGNYGSQQGDGRANTPTSSQREDVVAVTGAFLKGRMKPGADL